QFTPDLMPSDITGTTVFDLQSGRFHLKQGPIFTSVLLADEVNRAPAKTQSALLEAMEERQVSIEGSSLPLPPVFITLATQNPVEYEGTYPLPEAQLDRFLVRVGITYMPPEQETDLLDRYRQGFRAQDLASAGLRSVTGQHGLEQCEAEMQQVTVERVIMDYITRISNASRRSPDLMLGASPRASVALLLATRAAAALDGRSYVTPDDVKQLASSVLAHRLVLRPEAQLEGLTQEDAVRRLLASVEVPR
ncbi:MAG: MoxR family ATPase, partial [Chloroflexota bacterium]|nr:MoxR family ATPase [Chloroflexota bacterium]